MSKALNRPYFNPRTREGCDKIDGQSITIWFDISIHAPVKGATCDNHGFFTAITNFNPRTREGCDIRNHLLKKGIKNFNPRTREGCDGLQIGSVTICSLINHIAN